MAKFKKNLDRLKVDAVFGRYTLVLKIESTRKTRYISVAKPIMPWVMKEILRRVPINFVQEVLDKWLSH